MFMLYKIEAGLSFAQVRVSRTVEGFLNNIILIYQYYYYMRLIVNLIKLHKSACLSGGA